ncbi:hypothetical protein ACLOJK_013582 [Asimina triloba]
MGKSGPKSLLSDKCKSYVTHPEKRCALALTVRVVASCLRSLLLHFRDLPNPSSCPPYSTLLISLHSMSTTITAPETKTMACSSSFLLRLLLLSTSISLFLSPAHADSPAGIIERNAKQQVLASLPPDAEGTGASQPFITSPSGKYEGYLLRRQTTLGAGGFGNDFCYIQIQASGHAVWESDCAAVSNENACTLLFTDAGLEIFDGSRSSWDTNADSDDPLATLELIDRGDMQIRDKSGNLAWKASDNPVVNQECGSPGAPGLNSGLPPFASPIPGSGLNFGQPQPVAPIPQRPVPAGNQPEQAALGDFQQQPLSQQVFGLNSPFGTSNQPLVDNTPFDSGARSLGAMLVLFQAVAALVFVLAALVVGHGF